MFRPTKKRKPQSDRDIFTFWDGSAEQALDPLPVWYKLWQTEDIDSIFKRAANNELEAVEEMVQLARSLFGLPAYDAVTETGLTELESQKVLLDFLQYCNELKKKHGPLPMPWQKLAPSISSETSTTPPAAESSSSPSELPSAEPSTTCTPSVQP